MEAIRGAALSSDRQSDCARFAALDPRNEPLARRSQHGVQPCTRSHALQWWLWGERREGTRGGSSHLSLRRSGREAASKTRRLQSRAI